MWVANAVSPILPETPEAAHAAENFSIDGQTTGAKGANLFAGFTNPALNIITGNATYSASGHKYAKASDNSATFVSTYSCMDSEVTVRMGIGQIALRYDAATGTCLSASINANGSINAGANASGGNLTSFGSLNAFQFSVNLASFGWTALNESDVFTFGAIGFTCYVKWNGITVLSWTNIYQPIAGKCIVWGHGAYDGVSDTTITYMPATGLYSNRAKKHYDLRDFGLKSVATTGSMASGSNQITVADASNLVVGDRIIVATGGEAGAGLRGTMGVGGAFPALSYADATAMNADTSQPDFKAAWLRSTGFVYRYNSSNGTWVINRDKDGPEGVSLDGGDYYTQRASPLALVATITAKVGNVLTLDQTSSAATTNAEVYFDNYAVLARVLDEANTQQLRLSIRVPPGAYALGQAVAVNFKHYFTLGALDPLNKPKFFAPKGGPNLQIGFSQSDFVTIENLQIEGNHKPVGVGSHAQYFRVDQDATTRGAYVNIPRTLRISYSAQGLVRGCDVSDVMAFAVNLDNATFTKCVNNTLTMNARIESYQQWFFQLSGAIDCTVQNCSVAYSISLCKAFETFVGTRNRFINCGGMNALCSTNNSWDWVYDGFYSTITADSYSYINAGFWNEPVMNISDNAYQSGTKGLVKNPRIVQTGYINDNHDTIPAIMVAAVVTDVQIIGEYEGVSAPYPDNLGGFLSAPDYGVIDPNYMARSSTQNLGPSSGLGVVINAPGTVVRGLRIVGAAKSTRKNFEVASTATGSTVEGCIADTFAFQADTIISGNRTNAGVTVP